MSENICACGLSHPPSIEDIVFIDFDEVQEYIPLSKSRLYTLMNEGEFPKPVKIGIHRAVWIKQEILDYRSQRIEARNSNINQTKKIKE